MIRRPPRSTLFPTRRSSDLSCRDRRGVLPRPDEAVAITVLFVLLVESAPSYAQSQARAYADRSEEHTSELQSLAYLVCRLLLEKKKKNNTIKPSREPSSNYQ